VLSGTLIATLATGTYGNPQTLYDATDNPAPVQATATVVGNVLTITKNAGFFGTVVATVAVDDGNGGQDSQTFQATFLAARRSARSSGRINSYRTALDEVLVRREPAEQWVPRREPGNQYVPVRTSTYCSAT